MRKRNNFGTGQVTFRRFGGKGWCIFRSLSLNIRIGVLTVATLASAVSSKAHAEVLSDERTAAVEDEGKEMEEVTVQTSIAPLTMLQSARVVTVITRREIEQAGATTVNDLLKMVSGVDVRQRGGWGLQTDISVDGGSYEQVTILLNGLNISNPHTGHLVADFPVTISDIERIEVLEGASGRVYGSQAFGGAVNVVTRKAAGLEREKAGKKSAWNLDVGVDAGMHGTVIADGRAGWQVGKLYNSISFAGGRSDGGVTNGDWKKGNVYLQGCYAFSNTNTSDAPRVYWQFGYSGKSYGANTFYSGSSNDQYESNDRVLMNVQMETGKKLHLSPSVYWIRTYDDYQWHRGTPTNSHYSDVYGVRLNGWFQWVAGRTAFGSELRQEGIASTSLGNHDRTNVSFNLEHNVLLRRWTVSAGLSAVMNTGVDKRFRFYPGVDVAYRPSDEWKILLSYNMGVRLPSYTDLYYSSPDISGNERLKPERNQSLSFGVTWTKTWLRAQAKIFYNHGDNIIDYVKESWKDVAHADNFNRDAVGVSAEAKLALRNLAGSPSAASWMPDVNLSYTYLYQKREEARFRVFTSLYGDDYLRHKMVLTVNQKIWDRLSVTLGLRVQDRMGTYQVYEGTVPTPELRNYVAYATMDAKIQWSDKRYEVWVKGENLSNHHYQDIGNVPQPGIWVMSGVRIKLNF